jgi:hypothetical protein
MSGGEGTQVARVCGRSGMRPDDQRLAVRKLMYPFGTRAAPRRGRYRRVSRAVRATTGGFCSWSSDSPHQKASSLDPATARTGVAGSRLSPRQAAVEPRVHPAHRSSRRFIDGRTRALHANLGEDLIGLATGEPQAPRADERSLCGASIGHRPLPKQRVAARHEPTDTRPGMPLSDEGDRALRRQHRAAETATCRQPDRLQGLCSGQSAMAPLSAHRPTAEGSRHRGSCRHWHSQLSPFASGQAAPLPPAPTEPGTHSLHADDSRFA